MRRAIVALALSSTTVVLDTTSLTWLIWYCTLIPIQACLMSWFSVTRMSLTRSCIRSSMMGRVVRFCGSTSSGTAHNKKHQNSTAQYFTTPQSRISAQHRQIVACSSVSVMGINVGRVVRFCGSTSSDTAHNKKHQNSTAQYFTTPQSRISAQHRQIVACSSVSVMGLFSQRHCRSLSPMLNQLRVFIKTKT